MANRQNNTEAQIQKLDDISFASGMPLEFSVARERRSGGGSASEPTIATKIKNETILKNKNKRGLQDIGKSGI